MRVVFVRLLVLIFLPSISQGQSKLRLSQAQKLYNDADSLNKRDLFGKSLDKALIALPFFEKEGDLEVTLECKLIIASDLFFMNKFKEAFKVTQELVYQASEHNKEFNTLISKAYEVMGNCYGQTEKFDSAIIVYEKALNVIKSNAEISVETSHNIHNGLGIVYYRQGFIKRCKEHFTISLHYREKLYGKKSKQVAGTYHNIGKLLHTLKDYSSAIDHYLQAITINKNLYGDDYYFLASNYNAIGLTYLNTGEDDKASNYFRRAVEIANISFGDFNYQSGNAYHNMSAVEINKGNYEKALRFSIKAKNTFETIGGLKNTRTIGSFERIAIIYRKLGLYDSAHYYHNQSVYLAKKLFGSKNPFLAEIIMGFGDYYAVTGDYRKALEHYQKSICANMIGFNDSSSYLNPILKDYLEPNILLNALGSKSSSLRKLYHKTHDLQFLKQSLDTYQLCDSLINKVRSYVDDDIALAEIFSKIYGEAIEVGFLLFDLTEDRNYLKGAFYFSEKNKSVSLLIASLKSSAKGYLNVSDSLNNYDEELRINISFYESKLLSEKLRSLLVDSSKLELYNTKLFDLKEEQRVLIDFYEKNFPKYYHLKYDIKVPGLASIQSQMSSTRQTLIEYALSDSSIYVFVVDANSFQVKRLEKPSSFDQRVQGLHYAVKKNDTKSYVKYAYDLYKTVFYPIQGLLNNQNAIIIPDGVLWSLNFDLLLTGLPVDENYSNMDFLIRDYTLSYDYSATMKLQEKSKNRASNNQNRLLAFSYGVGETDGDKVEMRTVRNWDEQDLPGSRKEIKMISQIMDGDYYYGNRASESNFKKYAKNYAFLHIALHGKVDEENPGNSKLFFTPSADSVEDGYLYIRELYNMQLEVELAVLSACNTGTGKLVGGEGIMSLGRAFTYAGCKSLVLTLWELSDGVSPIIMRDFYQNLNDGLTKAESLRQAKLKQIEGSDMIKARPFYWGVFVLVGDTDSIEGNNFNRDFTYGVFVLVAIFLIAFYFIRRSD